MLRSTPLSISSRLWSRSSDAEAGAAGEAAAAARAGFCGAVGTCRCTGTDSAQINWCCRRSLSQHSRCCADGQQRERNETRKACQLKWGVARGHRIYRVCFVSSEGESSASKRENKHLVLQSGDSLMTVADTPRDGHDGYLMPIHAQVICSSSCANACPVCAT